MKLKGPIDAGLYVLTGCVLLALAFGFATKLRDGATAEDAARHYEEMKQPLPAVKIDAEVDEPDQVPGEVVVKNKPRKRIFRILRRRRR